MAEPSPRNTAIVPSPHVSGKRDVDTVPFVELSNNRLQGVVSSGSDVERVYCAFLEAGTGAHYSSTNNNRPDAGTGKRLTWLTEQAVAQFGTVAVARFLQLPGDPAKYKSDTEILNAALRHSARRAEPVGEVFARFLNYLRFVELTCAAGPVPEMAWFAAS